MAMVCPKCQGSFQQRLQCPSCNVRLEYQAGGRSVVADRSGHTPRGGWQETPWGRIAVGLMLAQGFYYGLYHLGNAGMIAVDPEMPAAFWSGMTGLMVVQTLQALGLLLGGALAGAGRQRGIMFGALVGVWNGLIFIIVQTNQHHLLTPVALYGQPLLQTAFGAIGGAIGRFIWKPLPILADPASATAKGGDEPTIRWDKIFRGPIGWVRVLIGSAAVVAGATSATLVLDFVLDAGQGKFTVETHLQAHLITWEITALAVVIGSGLAGANTRNGLTQGLCVGILSSVVLAGMSLAQDRLNLLAMILTVATALGLSLAGGWFGASLFPPLIRNRTRRGNSGQIPVAV